MNIERERKFICDIDDTRALVSTASTFADITQWYLSAGDSTHELRVRQSEQNGRASYVATLKHGDGLEREELEVDLAPEAATVLTSLALAVLRKRRYYLPGRPGLTLDTYQSGPLRQFGILELEQQPNAPDIMNFDPAELCIRGIITEITGKPYSRNRQHAVENDFATPDTQSLEALTSDLDKRIQSSSQPVVLTLGGPSGSGKTTLLEQLKQHYPGSIVLCTDDYYIGETRMSRELPAAGVAADNFDHPLAFDLALLKQHIKELKDGQTINRPAYDLFTCEPKTETVAVDGAGTPAIFVEGIAANLPEVTAVADITAAIHTAMATRLTRRMKRDITRNGFTPQYSMSYILNVAEPAYTVYYAPGDTKADYIIDNN